MRRGNGWVVRVADFGADGRRLPSRPRWGPTCPWVPPLPLCSVNTDIPLAWGRYLAKALSRIQRPAMTRVMWLTQKGVFCAAPEIMRTSLFGRDVHVVVFGLRGAGGNTHSCWVGPRAEAGFSTVAGERVTDNFLNSEFYSWRASKYRGRQLSSWHFNPGPAVVSEAPLSRLYVRTCSEDRYRNTRLSSSWQHIWLQYLLPTNQTVCVCALVLMAERFRI